MALLDLQSERLRAVPVARLSPQDREALFEPEVVAYLPDGFQGLETDAARCWKGCSRRQRSWCWQPGVVTPSVC